MSYNNNYTFQLITYFFSFFVEAILLWHYCSTLFVSKHKTKVRMLSLVSFYSILFLASTLESAWLNILLYSCINCLFIYLFTNTNIKTSLFHSLLLTSIMGMCELIAYGIITNLAPHFLQSEKKAYLFIFAIFNKTIFMTVIFAVSYLIKQNPKYPQQSHKAMIFLILFPLTSIFVMLSFVFICESTKLHSNTYPLIILSAIMLLLSNLLIFWMNQYTQKKNMEFTQLQLLIQKENDSAEYYEMLREQNETQRILIHDIKKHLQSILILNEKNENKLIKSYIQQVLTSSDLKESSRLCDNDLLNSILCRYQRQCFLHHISFHADIRKETTQFLSDADLTTIYCNLLDNAFEAAHKIPDSFIEINTSARENTPFVTISVLNSCQKKPRFIENGIIATTKKDSQTHGFGLKSIRRTAKKYDGDIQIYYDQETATFRSILTLKRKL